MFKTITSDLIKKPVWMLFLLTWLFYLIGLFMFSRLVWDSNTYMLSYKGTNFDTWIRGIRRIDLLRYALSPLWVIGISSVIWLLIKSGLVILRVELKNTMLLKIIFLGFLLISLPFWIKSIWFILIRGSYTPDDIKYFFPFSIVSLIDTSGMSLSAVKIISRVNLFHLAFILFVAWMISMNSELKYSKSIIMVFCTYGFGLALLQGLIFVITV
jgi:hypothetical protein